MYRSLSDFASCTSPGPQRTPAITADRLVSSLREIPMHQGLIFVPWQLEYVQALVRGGKVSARQLDQGHHLFQPFLRELFMLAAKEALADDRESCIRELVEQLRPTRRASSLD